MSKSTILIGAAAFVGALFFLTRGGAKAAGIDMSSLPMGRLIPTACGAVYVTAPRPATSFDLAMQGGAINLANSEQVIRPAAPADFVMGYL